MGSVGKWVLGWLTCLALCLAALCLAALSIRGLGDEPVAALVWDDAVESQGPAQPGAIQLVDPRSRESRDLNLPDRSPSEVPPPVDS